MLNLVANGPSGYNLTNSLRFRSSASAYLNRTPASASNRKTWTWSGWIKLGIISVNMETLFIAQGQTAIYVNDGTNYSFRVNGAAGSDLITNLMPRDPASWYHLVVACDTTQATDTNRLKIYVNGVQQTSFQAGSAYPTLNGDTYVNSTAAHYIGRRVWNSDQQYDGYLTEVNFIDGQALTPSSFGSTNVTTGVWQPAKYTGTYGTNGFYLNFSNIALTSGSNTGLGKDYSGNGNYWNTNNISVTSGTTYDAMTDVPTLTSATVANYATLNPLNSLATCSDANLKSTAGASYIDALSTIACDAGSNKWYFEATLLSLTSINAWVGITKSTNSGLDHNAVDSYRTVYQANGAVYRDGTGLGTTSTGVTYTTNDIIGIALDSVSGSISFYKNNTLINTTTDNLYSSNSWFFYTGQNNSSWAVNFGQRPFTYTPPTGYVALNTYNLPTSTIVQGNKYMDATLYTGTAANQTVVNAGSFQPDLVWTKGRSYADYQALTDSVRGASIWLASNTTGAEANYTANDSGVKSFVSNGFTLQADGSQIFNKLSATYVAWQWQAGKGTTSSNTSGSITSTVSVNASAGFSVVTYAGTLTSAGVATVGHGLGVAPKMIISKSRGTSQWVVQHTSLTSPSYFLYLNTTDAQDNKAGNGTMSAPTSTVFSTNWTTGLNTSGSNFVAYCWAEIAGFSKFGSYVGNGSSDGPFTYLGFRPKYVMIKNSGGGATSIYQGWIMLDTSRSPYNVTADALFANNSNASSSNSIYGIDILSNGFKTRGTDGAINESSATYIYAAFAENPFKNALAR